MKLQTIRRTYVDARQEIDDGDILLYRPNWKLSNKLISRWGHTPSPYCHAGMTATWRNRLFLLEMVQWVGGRAKALSQQVNNYPGKWDVWKVKPSINYLTSHAAEAAINDIGRQYGGKALARAALTHLPWIRQFFPRNTNDKENGSPAFCSMAVSRWMRKGNVDPFEGLADNFTEPGDLVHADSPLEYFCTLI